MIQLQGHHIPAICSKGDISSDQCYIAMAVGGRPTFGLRKEWNTGLISPILLAGRDLLRLNRLTSCSAMVKARRTIKVESVVSPRSNDERVPMRFCEGVFAFRACAQLLVTPMSSRSD